MFITSRESAIVPLPSHRPCPGQLSPDHLSPDYLRTTGLTLGDCLAPECVSVGFRCPEHISASRNRTSKGNTLFCWVFTVFLEWRKGGILALYYMLWFSLG